MNEARSYSGIGGNDEAIRRAQIERGIYMNQLFRRVFAGFGRRAARKPAAQGSTRGRALPSNYWI